MNCTCKKSIPYDNGDCSNCGKPTGRGLLIKVDFKPSCPWSKILHENWPEEFNEKGENKC